MESSLTLQLSDLASETGGYLGFGRTASSWTGWSSGTPYVPVAAGSVAAADTQLGWVMAGVQGGLRQFYFPPLVDDGPTAYEWSFLTPERTLNVVASDGVYDLPDDFRDLLGDLTYDPTASSYVTVKEVGIGQISRYLQSLNGVTAKPTHCAVYPKASDGATGQRWQISFAPLPDAAYTLTYRSALLPQALSVTNPYPLGGAAHGETIVQSCLAWAEARFVQEQSVQQAKFLERLRASVALDRELRPAFLGYCGDDSDQPGVSGERGPWNPWPTETVGATYNGVQY